MNEKWTLESGCHRGTLMSRDCGQEIHNSLEECEAAYRKAKESWSRMGYSVWYAYAISPTGERHRLDNGVPYAR